MADDESVLALRERTLAGPGLARIELSFRSHAACVACRQDFFAWMDGPENAQEAMSHAVRVDVRAHRMALEAVPEDARRIEAWLDGWDDGMKSGMPGMAAVMAWQRARRVGG